MAYRCQRCTGHQRRQQKQTDHQHHQELEKAVLDRLEDTVARLRLDAPDGVQVALQLGEDAGGADQQHDNAEDRGPGAKGRSLGVGQHRLNGAGAGRADEIFDLIDDLPLGCLPPNSSPARAVTTTSTGASDSSV